MREAMRVLYVNPFSQEVSGPDESLMAMLPALQARGVEAHLALPASGPMVPRYQALGVKVHVVPMSILKRSLRPADLGRHALRLGLGVAALVKLIRRERIELVHTNMEVVLDGAVAARLCRIPHVLHYRGNTLDEPRRVFDALVALWTRTSDHVFCISESTAAIFRKRGQGPERVEVLYNGLPLQAFRGAVRDPAVRASLGAAEGTPLVGTVGRIHPRKDVETFVRAAAQVHAQRPEARFVVVGTTEFPEERAYLERLEGLVKELGLEGALRFAGARRDVPAVMKALDVFVLASRHEGFGRVVAEALAAGTPQVVTREGALPELVEAGITGLHAAPADPRDFAGRILQLLASPEARARMAVAAVLAGARFDAERVGERVLARYEALVGARRG